MRRPFTRLDGLAGALLVLALAAALLLTRGAFWPFALAWIGAALTLVALRHSLARVRAAWIAITVLAVVACPILAFEGGLFVLPAALAFAVAETSGRGRSPAGHPGPGRR